MKFKKTNEVMFFLLMLIAFFIIKCKHQTHFYNELKESIEIFYILMKMIKMSQVIVYVKIFTFNRSVIEWYLIIHSQKACFFFSFLSGFLLFITAIAARKMTVN